jgi:autotransporter-associated beta strand protein
MTESARINVILCLFPRVRFLGLGSDTTSGVALWLPDTTAKKDPMRPQPLYPSKAGHGRRHLLSTAFLLGLATQTSWSESISYNFSENPTNQTLDTSTPKGPLGTTHWNDSNGEGAPNNGSEAALLDGSGNPTAASITWSSANTWYNGSGTGSQDARIMVGYLDDGGSGVSVTVSDIPYAKYAVYGIVGSDQGGGSQYSTRDFLVNGSKWAFPSFPPQLDNAGSTGDAGDTVTNTGSSDPFGALAGSTDPAFAFTNQSATVPYNAAFNPASFTVDAWINPANLDAGNRVILQSMINGQNPANGDDRSGWVFRQNGDTLTFLVGGTGPAGGSVFYTTTATTGAVLTAGVWQHVAVSYDAGTQNISIYVNGTEVLDTTATAPVLANTAAPLVIGNRGYGGWGFVGSIDELALYPGVLSEATLDSHVANGNDAGRTTPYATLVQASAPAGYWTGATFLPPTAVAGTAPAFNTWQASGQQWVRIKPDGSQRGNYWRVGGQTGSTCTIQAQPRCGDFRGSLAAIIIEESITPTQLVEDGNKVYDEVALGSGLTSEFRPGVDLTSVDLAGGFSTAATHNIAIALPAGLESGTYPLIDYTGAIGGSGFAGLSLAPPINPRYGITLVDNVDDSSVDVAITAPAPIVWAGGSGVWDTATQNWKLESTPTLFYPHDLVKFDDNASTGNVAISGEVSPNAIEIVNETLPYSFTGDPIAGTGGLIKDGAAALVIGTSNSFTGPVEFLGGTVEISAADNLGAAGGALLLDSVTLHATQSLTLGRKMTVVGPATVDVGAGLELTAPGGFNGGGTLTKTGEGSLVFNGYGGGSFSGDIDVTGGTLVMGGGAFNANLGILSITVRDGATLLQPAGAFHAFGGAFTTSPTLWLEEGATFTINQENYFDTINLAGAVIDGGNEVRTDMAFNANILASTQPSVWSARISGVNSPVTFNVEDGAPEADLVVSGAITNSQPVIKNGAGTLELTGPNTYTGDTVVNDGILAVDGNALPNPGKLVIDGGKVAPTGTEVVSKLFFGTEEQLPGTYGASGSGAQNIDDVHFSGNAGVVAVGLTYGTWIAGYPGAASAAGFDQDADLDGISNGVEQVLGTDPSVSSTGLTQVSSTGNSITFRHTRTNNPALDVTPSYQWSSDLSEWNDSGVANTGGTVATLVPTTITDTTAPANDVIEVVATASGTPSAKLFVRLVATANP